MLGVLRIFFASGAGRQATVLICLLLAGLAEGVGLASLLPVLSVAAGETTHTGINGVVLDALTGIGLPTDLGMLLIVVVAGIALKSALTLVAMNHVGFAVAEVATGLRMKLIDRLLDVRWGYFTRQPVGRFANLVSQEATRASEAYLGAALVVSTAVQGAVYVVLAFIVSWPVALVSVALGGGIVGALTWLVRMSRRAGQRQTKRTAELVAQLTDALNGIKPLKAMARHVRLARVFQGQIDDLNLALRRQVWSRQAMRSLQEPLITLFLAIGFYLAVTVWAVPLSQLIVMSLLLARTVTILGRVQQQLQLAAVTESAYWGTHQAIAEAEAERETLIGGIAPTLEKGIAFDRVSFAFGRKQVLNAVDLLVPAGEVTVILGPSGAGKTTIADLMLGLYTTGEGRVLIDDMPIESIDIGQWRSRVGYVPQELFLFHDTVLANVTLGDEALGRAEANEALEAAGAGDFVRALPHGLDTVVGERGMQLSGGQRQRIALARALVHKPRLLILDEVTSALDPQTEAEIVRNIGALAGRLTVVVITHQPAWLAVGGRVYRLAGGRATLVTDRAAEARAAPAATG